MNVERQLHIVMAALAALGSLLLGMGQQNPWLPLIAATCAALSLYFTDITGTFHLHRHVANGFALLAVILSIREFYQTTSEDQLLAIANLLIYLQLVLLFQQKSDRVYWQLIVLSVLQVVVAAALNLGFEFGVLLALYLVIVLTALFLFFLHRDTRLRPEENPEGEALGWEAISPLAEILADKAEPIESPDRTENSAFAQIVRRTNDGRLTTIGNRPLPLFGMAREIGVIVLTTVVFAVVIFYSVPRTADASWRWTGGRRNTRVGFSPEVTLNDSGQIGADETAALRISFHSAEGEPYILPEAPYIRGAVLLDYHNGSWQNPWRSGGSPNQVDLQTPPDGAELVRQEIVLETPQERALFAVFPIYRLSTADDNLLFDLKGQRLHSKEQDSAESRRSAHYRYLLATTVFHDGSQSEFAAANDVPPDVIPSGLPGPSLQARFMAKLRGYNKEAALARVKDLANQVLAGVPANDLHRKAKTLENHFRLSTEYQYTLDFDSIQRNPDIDPVEDFCLNHKKGNCRYFASALAIMLRTQQIPSRIVVGYRGGEYNSLGHFFVVRQKHAHAWVEAYLTREQVPEGMLPKGLEDQPGFWLRLDPTPVDGLPLTVSAEVGVLAYIGECLGYAQLLWSDYVVQLNSERQQEAIFKPIAEGWRERFKSWIDQLGFSPESGVADYWYVWLLLGMATLAGALGALFRWGHRWWFPLIAGWSDRGAAKRGRKGSNVAFFRRLEELLAKHGWTRRGGQTQREFAVELIASLKPLPRGKDIGEAISELVEAYYQIRYSGAAQALEKAVDYEQRIDRLESDLRIATKPTPAAAM